jgi:hypothetical protein
VSPRALLRFLSASATSACLLLAGCEPNSVPQTTDSQTNWLKSCSLDADCGAFSCVCNVCTLPCSTDAACVDAPGSECVGSGPPRADVDCPTGQTFSVQLSQPGCTATPSPAPPRESIEDAGVDSISGPETTDGGALDGGACEQPCNIELPCPSGMTCLAGCCRFTDPR